MGLAFRVPGKGLGFQDPPSTLQVGVRVWSLLTSLEGPPKVELMIWIWTAYPLTCFGDMRLGHVKVYLGFRV